MPSTTCRHSVREIHVCKEEREATVATQSRRGTRHTTSETTRSQTDCRSLRVTSSVAARHWIGSTANDQCQVASDLVASHRRGARPNSTAPASKHRETCADDQTRWLLHHVFVLFHVRFMLCYYIIWAVSLVATDSQLWCTSAFSGCLSQLTDIFMSTIPMWRNKLSSSCTTTTTFCFCVSMTKKRYLTGHSPSQPLIYPHN